MDTVTGEDDDADADADADADDDRDADVASEVVVLYRMYTFITVVIGVWLMIPGF